MYVIYCMHKLILKWMNVDKGRLKIAHNVASRQIINSIATPRLPRFRQNDMYQQRQKYDTLWQARIHRKWQEVLARYHIAVIDMHYMASREIYCLSMASRGYRTARTMLCCHEWISCFWIMSFTLTTAVMTMLQVLWLVLPIWDIFRLH